MAITIRDPREAPIVFDQAGEFASVHAAERALRRAGFSCGPMQDQAPRALVLGRARVGKWSHLTHQERKEIDGEMWGCRDGAVRIVPSAAARPEVLAAFDRVRRDAEALDA